MRWIWSVHFDPASQNVTGILRSTERLVNMYKLSMHFSPFWPHVKSKIYVKNIALLICIMHVLLV